jgi:hypothetical protein
VRPTRLRLFQGATSGRRQRLAGRCAQGLSRREVGSSDLFCIDPRHDGVPNLKGVRVSEPVGGGALRHDDLI